MLILLTSLITLQISIKNATAITELNTKVDNQGKVLVDHEGRIQTLEKDNKVIKTDVSNTQNQVNINTKDIADLKGKVGQNIGNVQVDIKDIKNNITNINSKVEANATAINNVNVKVNGVKVT